MESSTSKKSPERTAVVQLPTAGAHSYIQTVIGKVSPISPDLEEYRGIPYGTVSARWEHSQLREALPRDVFDATKNGPKCPQPSGPNTSRTFQSYLPFPDDPESEFDCLNLFIIRPSVEALARKGIDANKQPLPVMVWIHGGGFAFGAGTDPMWDPARLVLRSLQQGRPIIAVSINYRLNLFGFAASSDLLRTQDRCAIKGLNFGLRDQKVALAWVARNIRFFGGDAAKVTVGGQSAGSVSVHYHYLEANSGRENPLLRKAIMQSGSVGTLGPLPVTAANERWERLCKYWSVDSEPSGEARVDLLRRVPADDLVQAASELEYDFPVIADGITVRVAGPILEGAISADFGPVALTNEVVCAPQKPLGMLMGVVNVEASIFSTSAPSWTTIESIFAEAYAESSLRSEVMQAYGLAENATSEQLLHSVWRLLSDTMFDVPVAYARKSLNTRQLASSSPDADIHYFHVEFGNPFPGPSQGISHHCVEMIYSFNAFEDALVKADAGIFEPYPEPGAAPDVVAADQTGLTPVGVADSGVGDGISDKRTNIQLAHAVQDDWLDFIIEVKSRPSSDLDEITVYGNDRSTRTDSLVDSPIWKEKSRRWELLAKDFEAAVRVSSAIRKSSR